MLRGPNKRAQRKQRGTYPIVAVQHEHRPVPSLTTLRPESFSMRKSMRNFR